MVDMTIKVIPALVDNYMYLLIDGDTREAAAIDPVEPEKVLSAARQERCELICVLITHCHWDHTRGNLRMKELIEGITVLAGDERVEAANLVVSEGDSFRLGQLEVGCIATPGHTRGDMSYTAGPPDLPPVAVFTGDSLSVGGCGRLLEGNEHQMYETLIDKLGSLPPRCLVYCGHEHAVSNLKFALMIEPDNPYTVHKLIWAVEQRKKGLPTVPTRIGYEKMYNPFMRVNDKKIQYAFGNRDGPKTLRDIMYKRVTTNPSKYMGK